MKRLLSVLLAVVMLVFPCCIAESADTTIAAEPFRSLETYAVYHDTAMNLLDVPRYGYDAYLDTELTQIEIGEVNDAITYSIDDPDNGFVLLMMPTGTTQINGVWAFLPHMGTDYTAPKFLLEYCASILYGSGFIDDFEKVTNVMYELNLYSPSPFAFGASGRAVSEDGTLEATYQCSETLGIFIAINAVKQ